VTGDQPDEWNTDDPVVANDDFVAVGIGKHTGCKINGKITIGVKKKASYEYLSEHRFEIAMESAEGKKNNDGKDQQEACQVSVPDEAKEEQGYVKLDLQ